MDEKEIKSINNIPICDETARSNIVKKLDKNQGNENAGKLLVVDENGYIRLSNPDDIDFNNQYVLPIATSELLGGVKPVSKTSEMTKEVGVDENGKLFVKEDITQEEITQLKNKSDFSGKWDDLEGKPTIPDVVTVDTSLSSTSTNPVQNKVIKAELDKKAEKNEIPTNLSSLNEDETHQTVTADEKKKWDSKSDFDGDFNSLNNIPNIPDAVIVDAELNEISTNPVQNKAVTTELNKKANTTDLGIDIITKTATDTDVLLENNTYYVFPEMSTLTITPPTAESGKLAICGFEFTSGSTATALTLKNCTLTNSDDVVANKTYEVNILNGSAIVRER